MKNYSNSKYYTSLSAYLFAGCGHLAHTVEKLAATADTLPTRWGKLPQLRTTCPCSGETCRSCGYLAHPVKRLAAAADTLPTRRRSLPQLRTLCAHSREVYKWKERKTEQKYV